MHSKVVYTVYRVLERAGHPTLRFHFRGVGRSQGGYSAWRRLEPTGPVTVRVVKGADHFFTGTLEELNEALEEIL